MPRVEVLVRIVGEGENDSGDLASSGFTMSQDVTRSWCAGDLEKPLDLARELGVTFRDSLRARIEQRSGVFVPESVSVASMARLTEGIYAVLEPEYVGRMPVRTEITINDLDYSELETRVLAATRRRQLRGQQNLVAVFDDDAYFPSVPIKCSLQNKKNRTAIPTRYNRKPVI